MLQAVNPQHLCRMNHRSGGPFCRLPGSILWTGRRAAAPAVVRRFLLDDRTIRIRRAAAGDSSAEEVRAAPSGSRFDLCTVGRLPRAGRSSGGGDRTRWGRADANPHGGRSPGDRGGDRYRLGRGALQAAGPGFCERAHRRCHGDRMAAPTDRRLWLQGIYPSTSARS